MTNPADRRASQTIPETIAVEQFDRMPYLTVLTYPRPNLSQAKSRIKQLVELGIEQVTFEGRTKIGRLGLVGIGTVGLVVKGTGKRRRGLRAEDQEGRRQPGEHGGGVQADPAREQGEGGGARLQVHQGHHVDALHQGRRARGLREGGDREGEREEGEGDAPTPS